MKDINIISKEMSRLVLGGTGGNGVEPPKVKTTYTPPPKKDKDIKP